MEIVKKRSAWNFALGLIKIDGLKPSDEFLKMVEKEINGEMTVEDIKKALDEKYKLKNDEQNDKNYSLEDIIIDGFEDNGLSEAKYRIKGEGKK